MGDRAQTAKFSKQVNEYWPEPWWNTTRDRKEQ